MTFQLKNRIRGTSVTTGTGTYTLAAAPAGFQAWSTLTSGRQVYYCAFLGSDWEVGIGTVTVGGSTTLSRDTVLESSSGGAVNWPAGTKEVFEVVPAEALAALSYDGALRHGDLTGTLKIAGILTAQGGINVAGTVAGTNVITATLTPSIAAYGIGMPVVLIPAGSNTGATTLALNGLTARSIVKIGAAALVANDLVAGVPAFLVYDLANTRWLLLNPQTNVIDLSVTTGTLALARGGTGAVDAAGARAVLGLGAVALLATINGSNWAGTDLAVVDGGTGASDAPTARTNLGAAATSHTHANGDLTGYTAADVLAKLITVDGFGSGLDADLLDGLSSAAFALAAHNHAASEITSGTFADARIAQSNVTQHVAAINHDGTLNYSANRHHLITVQNGGSASGGADGDIILIW